MSENDSPSAPAQTGESNQSESVVDQSAEKEPTTQLAPETENKPENAQGDEPPKETTTEVRVEQTEPQVPFDAKPEEQNNTSGTVTAPNETVEPSVVVTEAVVEPGSEQTAEQSAEQPELLEPVSDKSRARSTISAGLSQAEEEILSSIAPVEDWAEEDIEEEEIEDEEEEEPEEESIDYDRDKKNPQYIPRAGPYYLHDDRRGSSDEEEVGAGDAPEKDKQVKKARKKSTGSSPKKAPAPEGEEVASVEAEEEEQVAEEPKSEGRWTHDLFNADDETQPTGRGEQRLGRGGRYGRPFRGRRGVGRPMRRSSAPRPIRTEDTEPGAKAEEEENVDPNAAVKLAPQETEPEPSMDRPAPPQKAPFANGRGTAPMRRGMVGPPRGQRPPRGAGFAPPNRGREQYYEEQRPPRDYNRRPVPPAEPPRMAPRPEQQRYTAPRPAERQPERGVRPQGGNGDRGEQMEDLREKINRNRQNRAPEAPQQLQQQYDDRDISSARSDHSYQSRVFVSSSRGGPRRGFGGPPRRYEDAGGREQRQPEHYLHDDRQAEPRGDVRRQYSNPQDNGAARNYDDGSSAPQTKRYSSRKGFGNAMQESGDARVGNAPPPRGGGRGGYSRPYPPQGMQAQYGYQENYGGYNAGYQDYAQAQPMQNDRRYNRR